MILAVDPGLSGAFAYYDGTALSIRDMPTYVAKAGARRTDRRFIDEDGVEKLLRSCRSHASVLVAESVGGRPAQAAHGAFVFGYGYGVILGMAQVLGYRIEQVPPVTWKSALRVPADVEKSKPKARARATELLPLFAPTWATRKEGGNATIEAAAGRAESAMIALYGWQVFGDLKNG